MLQITMFYRDKLYQRAIRVTTGVVEDDLGDNLFYKTPS
jgi:hypothetical protein